MQFKNIIQMQYKKKKKIVYSIACFNFFMVAGLYA